MGGGLYLLPKQTLEVSKKGEENHITQAWGPKERHMT